MTKQIPHSELTAADVGVIVLDRKGKQIGCVIRVRSGLYAAWGLRAKLGEGLRAKLGEFPSQLEAADAVRAAARRGGRS